MISCGIIFDHSLAHYVILHHTKLYSHRIDEYIEMKSCRNIVPGTDPRNSSISASSAGFKIGRVPLLTYCRSWNPWVPRGEDPADAIRVPNPLSLLEWVEHLLSSMIVIFLSKSPNMKWCWSMTSKRAILSEGNIALLSETYVEPIQALQNDRNNW